MTCHKAVTDGRKTRARAHTHAFIWNVSYEARLIIALQVQPSHQPTFRKNQTSILHYPLMHRQKTLPRRRHLKPSKEEEQQWSEDTYLSFTDRTLITHVPHKGRFCIWFRAGGLWLWLPVKCLSQVLAGGMRKWRKCRTKLQFSYRGVPAAGGWKTKKPRIWIAALFSSLFWPRIRVWTHGGRGRHFTPSYHHVFELLRL